MPSTESASFQHRPLRSRREATNLLEEADAVNFRREIVVSFVSNNMVERHELRPRPGVRLPFSAELRSRIATEAVNDPRAKATDIPTVLVVEDVEMTGSPGLREEASGDRSSIAVDDVVELATSLAAARRWSRHRRSAESDRSRSNPADSAPPRCRDWRSYNPCLESRSSNTWPFPVQRQSSK